MIRQLLTRGGQVGMSVLEEARRLATVATVFVTLGAFGTAVGVVQVLLPAFADERGSAETGGLYLALLSAGSLAGGRPWACRWAAIRREKTRPSSSELDASRLAPWTPEQATSPVA